LKINNRPC